MSAPLRLEHVRGGAAPPAGLLPVILAVLLLAVVPQAAATVVVPLPVDGLAEQAVAVVSGRVTAIESYWDPREGQIFTHITLALDEVLKGEVPFQELTIKQLGGTVGVLSSWIFGSAEFVLGEPVILFLRLNPDGTLRVAHLYQGKFSIVTDEVTGEVFAYRGIPAEGVTVLAPAGAVAAASELHRLEAFKDRIRGHGAGAAAPDRVGAPVVVPSPSATGPVEVHDEFTFLGAPSRWFEPDPDINMPVRMFLNSLGEPTAPGLGFNQVRAGYLAWSTVAGSTFRYQDGGFTGAGGFQFDGVNAVSFRDPLGQMDPPVGCAGTLAIGGYSAADGSQTRTVNGVVFRRIIEGDLVFADGWGGCGFYENFAKLAEVATHELGHVLGLGHSADPTATMYFQAHFDGRGASLRADDIAGAVFMYPNLPLAPTNLTATAVTATRIDLAWQDHATTETFFKVKRKLFGGTFSTIATPGPNTTSFSDLTVTGNTTYVYKVKACAAGGCSAPTNQASATTPGAPAPPSGLTALAISANQVNLSWQDNAINETLFKIKRKILGGTYSTIATPGANTTSLSDMTVVGGTTYVYKVKACNANGCSTASNEATVTTP